MPRKPRTWTGWVLRLKMSTSQPNAWDGYVLLASCARDLAGFWSLGAPTRVTVTEAPPKQQKYATRKLPATRRKGTKT